MSIGSGSELLYAPEKGLHFLLPKKAAYVCTHCKTGLPLAGTLIYLRDGTLEKSI